MTMWGIHNDALDAELVEQGFISIGWEETPDLRTVGDDRTRMKQLSNVLTPSAKPGAIPVWAGLLRVAPSRCSSGMSWWRPIGQTAP